MIKPKRHNETNKRIKNKFYLIFTSIIFTIVMILLVQETVNPSIKNLLKQEFKQVDCPLKFCWNNIYLGVTTRENAVESLQANNLDYGTIELEGTQEVTNYIWENKDEPVLYIKANMNVVMGTVNRIVFELNKICLSEYLEAFGQPDIYRELQADNYNSYIVYFYDNVDGSIATVASHISDGYVTEMHFYDYKAHSLFVNPNEEKEVVEIPLNQLRCQ